MQQARPLINCIDCCCIDEHLHVRTDVLLEAETIDYAKGALSYYQRCLSLLPHLSHLTPQELKEAKAYTCS